MTLVNLTQLSALSHEISHCWEMLWFWVQLRGNMVDWGQLHGRDDAQWQEDPVMMVILTEPSALNHFISHCQVMLGLWVQLRGHMVDWDPTEMQIGQLHGEDDAKVTWTQSCAVNHGISQHWAMLGWWGQLSQHVAWVRCFQDVLCSLSGQDWANPQTASCEVGEIDRIKGLQQSKDSVAMQNRYKHVLEWVDRALLLRTQELNLARRRPQHVSRSAWMQDTFPVFYSYLLNSKTTPGKWSSIEWSSYISAFRKKHTRNFDLRWSTFLIFIHMT